MVTAEQLRKDLENEVSLLEEAKSKGVEKEIKKHEGYIDMLEKDIAKAEEKEAKEKEKAAKEEEKEAKEEEKVVEEKEKEAKEERGAAKEEEKAVKKTSKAAETARSALAKSWAGAVGLGGGAKRLAATDVPDIFLVMLLILVGIGDYLAKAAVGFEPITSGIFSTFTFLIFAWALRGKKWFELLLGFFIFDAVVIPLAMGRIPTNSVITWAIVFKTFVWPATAIIGFIATFLAYERVRKHVPLIAKAAMILLIILAATVGWSWGAKAFAEPIAAHQDKYYEAFETARLAKERVSQAIGEQYNVTKGFWARWWGALPYLLSGDIDKYQATMNPVKVEVEGEIDTNIKEYTKVEFEIEKEYQQVVDEGKAFEIPIYLNVESPEKEIELELSCSFKKAGRTVAGVIIPDTRQAFAVKGQKSVPVSCRPISLGEMVAGHYKAVFEAEIKGLETKSSLVRLFVGNMSYDDRERERVANGFEASELSKSAAEFAVFSFGIGAPISNPLVNEYKEQLIIGNIENKGNGIIKEIQDIRISSDAFRKDGILPKDDCDGFWIDSEGDFSFTDKATLGKFNLEKLKKGGKITLLSCYLEMPIELSEIVLPQKRLFISSMTYSYKISKEVPFEVKKALNLSIT
jgi:hypothetical protein